MIVFKNSGELDIRAVKTFGLSVKTSNEAIGYFGTGLKYAIAIFLRCGFEVRLFTAGKGYVFEKSNISSRGKDFEIITMNGEELPFTTHLGANWDLWQAFREIYCNALDEGGNAEWCDENDTEIDNDNTYFFLSGPGDKSLFDSREDIVLKCDFEIENDYFSANTNRTNWIYYRGIRVFRADKEFLYTYSIHKNLALTEDRTLRDYGVAFQTVARGIALSTDKSFIRKVICCDKKFTEYHFNFYFLKWENDLSSAEFREVAFEEFEKNNDDLNQSVKLWVKETRKVDTFKNIISCNLDDSEVKMFNLAKRIVERHVDIKKYEFVFSETLGETTMAYVHSDGDNRIFISRECFNKGQLFLTSTILEEAIHQKTGLSDVTRELQTYLFDEMTKLLSKLSGHERLII